MKGLVVYLHINEISKEVFYVGVGAPERPFNFKCRSKRWKEYVQANGNPVVKIYRSGLNPVEALHMEAHLINLNKRAGHLVNANTNLASAAAYSSGEAEARLKMSISHKRLKLFAKKIIDNSTGKVYDSITEAATERIVDVKVLSSWLRGKVKSKINYYSYLNAV
jgi:hypothetical protein